MENNGIVVADKGKLVDFLTGILFHVHVVATHTCTVNQTTSALSTHLLSDINLHFSFQPIQETEVRRALLIWTLTNLLL